MLAVSDLRDFLRAEPEDDAVLAALEAAAVEAIQQRTGRYFGREGEVTETRIFRGWPLILANAPLGGAITTVELRSGGAWEAVAASSYYLAGIYLRGDDWTPTSTTWASPLVRITYDAGYPEEGGDPNAWAAPADVKQAVRMLVGHWYENREAVVTGTIATEVALGMDMLLSAHTRAAF